MPPIARVFIVGMLLVAGAASAEDFKSQAAAAAAIFDDAFKAGDAAKVGQLYTKGAIILPAGGQSVKGPAGAEALFHGFFKELPTRTAGFTCRSGRPSDGVDVA